MLSGEHPSQVFYSMFADQQTGDYDVQSISTFLNQVNSNPQYQSFWSYLNEQAVLERLSSKFAGLVKAGTFDAQYQGALLVADIDVTDNNGKLVAKVSILGAKILNV